MENLTLTDQNIRRIISEWFEYPLLSMDIYGHIGTWDTSQVTNMSNLFDIESIHSENFNEDISNWDTSSVTDMSFMFRGLKLFNQPIGKWNTSNVSLMIGTFCGASSFNQSLLNWNLSSLTDCNDIFKMCPSLNQSLLNFHQQGIFFNTLNDSIIPRRGRSNIRVKNMLLGASQQKLEDYFYFRAGTPILTDQGLKLIENIKVEDTFNGVCLRGVVSFELEDMYMILFKENCFGYGIPSQDMHLCSHEDIYLDGINIESKYLINNKTIKREYLGPTIVYSLIIEKDKMLTMRVNNLLTHNMNPRIYQGKKIVIPNDNINEIPLPVDFDWRIYVKFNDDLRHLKKKQSRCHFLKWGLLENRNYHQDTHKIPSDFNHVIYKQLFDDLKKIDNAFLEDHFLKRGKNEKRPYKEEFLELKKELPKDFNWKTYLYLNNDLKKKNQVLTERHYVRYGKKEERIYKNK